MNKLAIVLGASVCFCSARGQGASPDVGKFIQGFSYAATRVDLKPDPTGEYPHLGELSKAVVDLDQVGDATLASALKLLDKNQSIRRLVVGDLLFLLLFDIPDNVEWDKPENAELRNAVTPPPASAAKSSWPWVADGKSWKLSPFSVAGNWDESLAKRYQSFKSRFKRRPL